MMSTSDWPETGDILSKKGVVLDHRFRLEDYLGGGPIHRVYRALDLLEMVMVCVKLPKPRFRSNDGFTQRYRRDVLNIMLHKNAGWITPQMLGEADGTPFQVLPLVEGLSLTDWYREKGRDHRALLKVLKSILKILGRLHSTLDGIHGSLKPGNILVRTEDDEPVLLDLSATGRLEDHFAEGSKTGQPIYQSPEQVVGERAAPPSDLYSLGLVLYEALALRHPYMPEQGYHSGQSGPEQLLAALLEQLDGKPSPASKYREDVPQWADRFLARCLQPHPSERFENTEEALEWLQHHTRLMQPDSSETRALVPIGREREMEALTKRLMSIIEEPIEGSLIRLRGPEGIGKTRCTDWLALRARRNLVRVVEIKKTPESGLHLQSVVNALKRGNVDPPTEARPVVEGLIEAALEGPLLIIFEEIQQADETLVELLREVHTVLSDLPILMILVDGEGEFRSPAAGEFFGSLSEELVLPPLDRRAIANIIEECAWSPPATSVVHWVHKTSEGNALAARLLVDYLQDTGQLKDDFELDWAGAAPKEQPKMQALIKHRLGKVSETAGRLLESAAVLGDTFSLNTLRAITYRDEEEVDGAIGEAVSANLLMVQMGTGGAPKYRWTHPLFARTLWNDIYPRRRQRVHRLAAAFYSRGEPEPAKLAYHFMQSNDLPELFHWGSLAVETTFALGLRGECNYWLNALLARVEDEQWLGPSLDKARAEVGRDQSEVLDIELWARWLRSLSGRRPSDSDAKQDTEEHLVQAQRLISSNDTWDEWKEHAADAITNLEYDSGRDGERAARCAKGLELLAKDWKKRSLGREPFPGKGD